MVVSSWKATLNIENGEAQNLFHIRNLAFDLRSEEDTPLSHSRCYLSVSTCLRTLICNSVPLAKPSGTPRAEDHKLLQEHCVPDREKMCGWKGHLSPLASFSDPRETPLIPSVASPLTASVAPTGEQHYLWVQLNCTWVLALSMGRGTAPLVN